MEATFRTRVAVAGSAGVAASAAVAVAASAAMAEATFIRREFVDKVVRDLAFYAGAWKMDCHTLSSDWYNTPFPRRLMSKVPLYQLIRMIRSPKTLYTLLQISNVDLRTKLAFWVKHTKGDNNPVVTAITLNELVDGSLSLDDVQAVVDSGYASELEYVTVTESAREYLRTIGLAHENPMPPTPIEEREIASLLYHDLLDAIEEFTPWTTIKRLAIAAGINTPELRKLRRHYLLRGAATSEEIIESHNEIDWMHVRYERYPTLARLTLADCERLRAKCTENSWKIYPEWAPSTWWDDNVREDADSIRSRLHSGDRWSDIFDGSEYYTALLYIDEYDRFYDLLIRHAAKDIAREWYRRMGEPGGLDYHQGMMPTAG